MVGWTSGRTKRQIASDLGVGLSTLTRWMAKRRDRAIDLPDGGCASGHAGRVEAPAARERDPAAGAGDTEASHRFFRPEGKSMRFALVDQAKKDFPVYRLCRVLGVSQSGYFAWKDRPASKRQHDDMVMLAHVRSAFALSNAAYGSPRMTRERQDDGFVIGRRHTARLMHENGLRARRIAAANIAPWATRPSCAATASVSRCQAREIATTTPWSRRCSK